MNGGPYGRGSPGTPMFTVAVGLSSEDRQLWQAACAQADPLEEHSGARAQHSTISNRNVAKGYGRWLTFLHGTDPACIEDLPAT